MPIPNLVGYWGLALMRLNHQTGDWQFLTFLNPGSDIIIDAPGPGVFTYQVQMIDGIQVEGGWPLRISGRQTMAITILKR